VVRCALVGIGFTTSRYLFTFTIYLIFTTLPYGATHSRYVPRIIPCLYVQYTDVHVSVKKITNVYIIFFIKGAPIRLDKMNVIHTKLQALKRTL
jgi:hypothetical protein